MPIMRQSSSSLSLGFETAPKNIKFLMKINHKNELNMYKTSFVIMDQNEIHDQTREAGVNGRGGLKPSCPTAFRLEWSSSSSRKIEKWEKTSKKSVKWLFLLLSSILFSSLPLFCLFLSGVRSMYRQL